MRWLLLTLVAACWTAPAVEPSPANSSTESVPQRVRVRFDTIALERTPCMGMCPSYTVTIFADGRVRWLGVSDVDSVGERVGHATSAQLRSLERMLDAIDFDAYDQNGMKGKPTCRTVRSGGTVSMVCEGLISICTDISHAIVTVRRGDKEHVVDDGHCDTERSKPLVQLEKLIDEVAGTRDWVGR